MVRLTHGIRIITKRCVIRPAQVAGMVALEARDIILVLLGGAAQLAVGRQQAVQEGLQHLAGLLVAAEMVAVVKDLDVQVIQVARGVALMGIPVYVA